ncbi:MAG TPA: hypothetical protein VGH95_04355 [Candidatus Aquirickettsiella sp.]|jgi:uncharacterized protein YaaW (UPF0174 family)
MFKHVITNQQAYFLLQKQALKKEREEKVYRKVSKENIDMLKKTFTKIYVAGPNVNLDENLLEMIEENSLVFSK